jgi:hypothetical protein
MAGVSRSIIGVDINPSKFAQAISLGASTPKISVENQSSSTLPESRLLGEWTIRLIVPVTQRSVAAAGQEISTRPFFACHWSRLERHCI